MNNDPNPYQSPHARSQPQAAKKCRRKGVVQSVLMILVGAVFCVASFYAVFGHGVDEVFFSVYRSQGRFAFAFVIFYGFAGLWTAVFHFSYLLRGWPEQPIAGIYAIFVALVLAGLSVALMECILMLAPA